jgi:hypothetical protein
VRRKLSILFPVFLVVAFAGALLAAQSFRSQARLFPIVIGIVGLGLAVLALVLEVRRQAGGEAAAATTALDTLDLVQAQRRTAIIMGWIVGFVVAVWLLGFFVAVPLLSLAYLRLTARERWPVSLAYAAVSGIVFYGLFGIAVRIPFDSGMLTYWLLG